MEKIKVNKAELQAKLLDNRRKHETEYNEAKAGWHVKALEAFNKAIEDFKNGDYSTVNPLGSLPKPQHHLKDYDLAIKMLEMSVDNEIEIEQHDFNQYVMDEWSWKAGFALTNSSYLNG